MLVALTHAQITHTNPPREPRERTPRTPPRKRPIPRAPEDTRGIKLWTVSMTSQHKLRISTRFGVGDGKLAHPFAEGVLQLRLLNEQVGLGR
jgi:hypothetical protein